MAATIQQIAEKAGVSRGTVDRALNHRGRIRPEVAARIEEIAAEMGYVPRHPERAKADRKQILQIGVVTQLAHASFMLEIRRGLSDISAKLAPQGVRVLLREGGGVDEQEQLRLIEELLQEGIDALAIMPVESDGVRAKLNMLITERKMPVITFNTDIVGTGRFCFVGLDNRKSGRTAAGLMGMLMHGQGKVLGIMGAFSNSAGSQRIDGFVEELKRSFPEMELVGVQSSQDSTEEVERIIVQAMRAYPDLEGILVTSGGQAGVKRAFAQLQPVKRPYVILYDLTPKNRRYLEEGTADFLIDQEGYEQGYQAVSLLADLLRWDRKPEEPFIYTNINIKTRYNL